MKRCCDNCIHLKKNSDGFYCPIKRKRITILYKYNGCKRFEGARLYERD